jgi:hypothetical protein
VSAKADVASVENPAASADRFAAREYAPILCSPAVNSLNF